MRKKPEGERLKVIKMDLPLRDDAIGEVASKGSIDGFLETFQEHRAALHSFLSRNLDSPEDVEDLVQEVYLRVARKDKEETIRYPTTYIFKTAGNLLNEHRKKAVRSSRGKTGRQSCDK